MQDHTHGVYFAEFIAHRRGSIKLQHSASQHQKVVCVVLPLVGGGLSQRHPAHERDLRENNTKRHH